MTGRLKDYAGQDGKSKTQNASEKDLTKLRLSQQMLDAAANDHANQRGRQAEC